MPSQHLEHPQLLLHSRISNSRTTMIGSVRHPSSSSSSSSPSPSSERTRKPKPVCIGRKQEVASKRRRSSLASTSCRSIKILQLPVKSRDSSHLLDACSPNQKLLGDLRMSPFRHKFSLTVVDCLADGRTPTPLTAWSDSISVSQLARRSKAIPTRP